ncbi:helix-turn-helix and ligand-binding sensor domain-containing protein [Flavobacterium muglaense]|uniref:Regulator n=1 Tax=Flavobacterium muglaense TaxID=2764716 RepID=A0A923SKR2_9FLAO|nr:triple tyrosine motif-containing protein [Flavobacterium muglaense]MBC5839073.1 regulator [Flavobacterium muglaense]MBC5845548.1 regulator [Flavobacterium muglaense]
MTHLQLKILALILFSTSLIGQVKNIGLPEIKNYKKTDYKGGTQNWNIDQDENGNIYFANNNGLFQFDGSTWRKYTLPNAPDTRAIKIDTNGTIFIGGYSEFGYYKPNQQGKLLYTSLSKKVSKKKVIDFIWKIHIYKDEVIFQSFANIYIYKNNQLKILEAPSRFQFSFQVKNHLYLQDVSTGLVEYKNGKLTPLPGTTFFNSSEIWGMFSLPDNQLLIATLNKGLFVYNQGKITTWNTDANAFIKKNSSLGGVTIKDKFIVLNSVLNGIIICDSNGKIIQHINRKKGLQNNTVLTSFIDHKNNLWLGLDDGIAFINENSPITYFGYNYDLSTVYASIVFNGNLYVATNQGVFFSKWHLPFREESFSLLEKTTGQAWNIQVIDGQLICGNNNGAMLINNDQSIKVLDTKGYFGFKKIPNKPNFIIGANYNGFAIFEKTSKGLEYRNQITGFEKPSSAFDIDDSYLWLKKDDVIYQMTLSDDLKKFDLIKTYPNISKMTKGIGSIQTINNTVYFQTNNVFYKYSQDQDLFYKDNRMSLLFKDLPKIYATTQDALGNIWYLFNESLGVLAKQNASQYKNIVTPFSNLTGNLVNNYLSVNAIDPQNIFIGQTNGLAHYNSKLPNNSSSKPIAFIRSISFPGDTLVYGNGKTTYTKTKVPYTSNRVNFTFSSPSYEHIDNIEFSYQLEGFDDKWSNWSPITIKEYTNLREGHYTMNLKARNSYGIQSDVKQVNFTISPPWYRHFIAYFCYILLIIAITYFIRNRIQRKIRKNKYYETVELRRQYLEKETQIQKAQFDLEKEIERLKNDNLQTKILSKDKELVINTLQVVKKNKVLNGIIHKLKEINIESLDDSTKFQFNKLNKSIVREVNTDKSWKDLEKHIKNVHFDFLKRLKEKHPTISPRELDLSTYLLMNMSTKEIAEIMNISNGGVEVARYRLRKKFELHKKEDLTGYLMSI